MTGRVRSDLFAAAWLRRMNLSGGFAVLRRRGAEEAGAIFIRVDSGDGTAALYGPAPQSELGEDGIDRRFVAIVGPGATGLEVEERLQRETRYDPDIWILEIEHRDGEHGLDLIVAR